MKSRSMPNDHKLGNKWRLGLKPTNAGMPNPNKGKKLVDWENACCSFCNKIFEIPPWIMRQNKSKSGNRFCSKKCHGNYMAKFKSGESSPQWVGGQSTYRGKGWLRARKQVVLAQSGECAHCRKYCGKSLPVHHIKPFREFANADEANAGGNLIGLCQSCHMKEERREERLRLVD